MKFSTSGGHFDCACGSCATGQTVDERDLPPDTRGDDRPDARTSDTLAAWSSQTNGEFAESAAPDAPAGVFASEDDHGGSDTTSRPRGAFTGERENASSASSKRTGVNYVGQGGPRPDRPTRRSRDGPGPVLTRPPDDDGGGDA